MASIDLQETQKELQWLDKKLDIKANRLVSGQRITVKRGDVYGCDFGYNLGSELRDYHPCVIIQNDATSMRLQTILVAPVTHASTRTNKPASLVPISQQVDAKGRILIEGYVDISNMRTVSKARLTCYKATLLVSDMKNIDASIASITDLYSYYKDLDTKLQTAKKHTESREEKIKAIRIILLEINQMSPADVSAAVRLKITEALRV